MSGHERSREELAEAVRAACLEAARKAYEEAGMSGLCAEGRWELALEAIRRVDLDARYLSPARFPQPSPSLPVVRKTRRRAG